MTSRKKNYENLYKQKKKRHTERNRKNGGNKRAMYIALHCTVLRGMVWHSIVQYIR